MRNKFLGILGLLLFLSGSGSGQQAQKSTIGGSKAVRPSIPVQEILARVDFVMEIPRGLLTGRLTAITRAGDTAVWDFSLYKKTILRDGISQTVMLYLMSSKRRGLEAKILIREDGDEIWLWDVRRNQLFRKRDLERFQAVMNTGFSFLDICGSTFQATYTGRRAVVRKISEKRSFTMLTMVPINPGNYRKLEVKADQRASYQPERIDYYDRNRVMFKSLNFNYGELLDKKTGKNFKSKLPVRMEMLNLNSGMISRMEYFTLDKTVSPQAAFFDPDFLNR